VRVEKLDAVNVNIVLVVSWYYFVPYSVTLTHAVVLGDGVAAGTIAEATRVGLFTGQADPQFADIGAFQL
jgi:hypothetical protein